MSTLPSRIRDPFTGQFSSRQHNAMDAVLWKAVELMFAEHGKPVPTDAHRALDLYMRMQDRATFSASLASAMEALGLELTTKTT